MKRNLDICRKCDCFRHVKWAGTKTWYCHNDTVSDDNGYEIGVVNEDVCWDLSKWNEMNISMNCNFYAEYFLMECNEKKA